MKFKILAAAFVSTSLCLISDQLCAQQGMGVGNSNPLEMLHVSGAIKIGTDIINSNAAPSGGAGTIRFKAGEFQGWDGTSWIPLGGGSDSPFAVNSNLVQPNTSFVTYATDDFIFGSPSLDDDGDTDRDGRFFYDKSKGAFRAGQVTGDQWDDFKRGHQSFAAGYDVTASGDYAITLGEKSWATAIGAIAMGRKAYAEGNRSLAWGNDAQATGEGSVALGRLAFSTADYSYAVGTDVNANGEYSVAFGYNADALNDYSVALGADVTAAADESVVLGYNSTTTGFRSVALGYDLTTVGDNSIAAGSDVTTLGSSSVAAGFNLSTFSAYEFVLGRYNTIYIPSSATSWQGTDRLLTVGNGTGALSRSDALTILKNGNTGIGTSAPSATLHLDGSLRIVDGNQNNGYVLTSDGSGNATWQAAGSGSDNQNLTGATLTGTTLEIDIEDGSSASVNLSALVDDADASATNELQTLSLSANTLSISAGNNVDLSGYVSTDDQNLTGATLTGTTLEIDIEGGNSASVSLASLVDDADASATNEIQTLSLSANTLSISAGNNVDLSGYVSTDDQNLTGATLTGTTLEIDIEGGSSTSVSLASLVDDADADASNELQTLSQSGTDVTLSNGGGTISVADNDNDASNEIQALSISGNDISLSNGGGTVSIPVQTTLADADNDTKIQVEESADEDIIRFDISGTETHRIEKLTNTDAPVIRVLSNSIYAGNNISADAPEDSNVAIGANSATALTSPASGNTFVGSGSGRYQTTASLNTYIGLRAGLSGTTASQGVVIGAYSGENLLTGQSNVFVGVSAAQNKTAGVRNTFLGTFAGRNNGTGTGNVFLGYGAGQNESGSDKLYIQNTNSTTPLIYGEFDNDIVGVNGSLGIGTQAPQDELHVAGSIRMVDGNEAAGLIPVSDANGTMTWTDPTTVSTADDGDWTISGNDQYSAVSGNVGIGDPSPDTKLHVSSGSTGDATGIKLTQGSANSLIYHNSDNDLIIRKAAQNDQLVLDNGGNIGVGTDAPSAKLEISGSESTTHGSAAAITMVNSAAGGGQWILRAGATGTQTPAGGFSIGNNTGYRMVIQNNGNVGVGTDGPSSKLHVSDNFGTNGQYVATIQNTANSGWANGLKIQAGQNTQSVNNRFISFVKPNGTEIGAVRQVTSSSVDYNTTSDERLKTNIQPTARGLNDLMQIEVKDYVYKEDLDKPQTGFIAQQVFEHYPNAVSPGGDDVKTDPWMMDYGKMSPLLVKAIQDQQEIIEMLLKRIEELEKNQR